METTYYIYSENCNTDTKTLVKVLDHEQKAQATVKHLESINTLEEVIYFYTYKSKAKK